MKRKAASLWWRLVSCSILLNCPASQIARLFFDYGGCVPKGRPPFVFACQPLGLQEQEIAATDFCSIFLRYERKSLDATDCDPKSLTFKVFQNQRVAIDVCDRLYFSLSRRPYRS